MTVLYFFPEELRTPWYMWEQRWNEIQEIRLRVNCPVSIRTISGERFLLNKEGECAMIPYMHMKKKENRGI